MNPLTSQWRSEAEQLRASANDLLTDEALPRLKEDVRLQVLASTAKVLAKMLEVQADSLDYLSATVAVDATVAKTKQRMEKANAIRTAAARGAATGDWRDFDKLVGESTGPADGS